MIGEVDHQPILIFLSRGSRVKPPSGEVSIVGSLNTLREVVYREIVHNTDQRRTLSFVEAIDVDTVGEIESSQQQPDLHTFLVHIRFRGPRR